MSVTWRGVFPAATTEFRADQSLDLPATTKHLDAMIRAGWNDAALKVLQADDRDRPTVPSTKRALGALMRKLGRSEEGMAAEYQAAQLSKQYREART